MLPLSYGLEVIHFLEHHKHHHRSHHHHSHHPNHHHHHHHHHSKQAGAGECRLGGSLSPNVAGAMAHTERRSTPLELVFRGITASCKKKVILREVSGIVKPGEVLAVMGPSGSGKTTLLNALSGRLKVDSGLITLNGEVLSKTLRRRICYVLQQDIFLPNLTLRQTLKFCALLRLPDSLTNKDKMDYVEHLADVLDLRHCLDTRVGDNMKRGLSGGEKKRANIACELLTNPTLLLIDEPTTGLDSSTAFSLMQMLKNYAQEEKKTIVVTVHQPSSQIFHMFDRLLLLCGGQVAYFGSEEDVVNYFSGIGYPISPNYNPADFIMELLKKGTEIEAKIISAAQELKNADDQKEDSPSEHYLWGVQTESSAPRVEFRAMLDPTKKLPTVYSKIEAREDDDSGRSSWSYDGSSSSSSVSREDLLPLQKWPTSFCTQVRVLSERNFLEARRRMLSKLNWTQTIGLGFISGLMWYQVERKEAAIFDIKGWMFFSSTYWMLFALFEALVSFPPEREVINKERASGAYRLSAYYSAKMIGELPLMFTLPTVFHIISYSMMGFHSCYTFLSLWGMLLLSTIVAQSVGLFVGASCTDLQMSVTISSLYSLSTMLFGGYYSSTIPPWLSWLKYLSMVHYTFQSMQTIEFAKGFPIKCSEQNTMFEVCRSGNASYIPPAHILNQGGEPLPLWANTLVLLLFLLAFRLMGYLALRYFRRPK